MGAAVAARTAPPAGAVRPPLSAALWAKAGHFTLMQRASWRHIAPPKPGLARHHGRYDGLVPARARGGGTTGRTHAGVDSVAVVALARVGELWQVALLT